MQIVAAFYTDKSSENFRAENQQNLPGVQIALTIPTTNILVGKSEMKRLKFAAALLLGLAISGPASAGVITIGTGTASNGFPFNASAYTAAEYQQVYNGALFGGPVNITQIAFFAAAGSTSAFTGNYTLHLSTTSATPTSLSLTYADNIGPDNALFFTGAVSHVLSFTGTPFLFDPKDGDLLLDVLLNTTNTLSGPLLAGCSPDTNRLFNLILPGGPGGTVIGNPNACSSPNSFGLQTQFTFTAAQVPEPSELALFGTGLLALLGVGALRRHRPAGG